MMRLEVEFLIDVPDDMPMDAAEEWISFEVGAIAQMTARHPQMERDLEPVWRSCRVSLAYRQPNPASPGSRDG
jgi:hypothetical protein